MQPDNLDVFDFDGTVIKVNSFREITKRFSVALLKMPRIVPVLALVGWFILRRIGIISHLEFKQRVVNIFEKVLTEQEKHDICQQVFDNNVNTTVFERMLNSNNCVISTAAPFAYISRLSFKKDVTIISSLNPDNRFPDKANFGKGKTENLKACFGGNSVRVVNFFTDCNADDHAMIDFSVNAFVVRKDRLVKVK